MTRRRTRWPMAFGSLAIFAALAPGPRAIEPAGEIKALAEARVKVGLKILDYLKAMLTAPPNKPSNGLSPSVEVAEEIRYWSRQVVDARLEAADRPEDRVAILTEEVAQAKGFEAGLRALGNGNTSGELRVSVDKAEFYRLEMETRLAKEKAGR